MAKNFRSRRDRPRYQWFRESQGASEVLNTSGGVELLRISSAEYTAAGFGDPTVVRIRGSMLYVIDDSTAVDGSVQRLAMGIIVVPVSVTAAELQGPLGQPRLNWLYWSVHGLKATTLPAASEEAWGTGAWRFDFDVKAMRRLDGEKDVLMSVENPGDSAAHVFVTGSWSVLLQD